MAFSDSPFVPGMRVVGYLRDSGHEEQELSVAQQEAELKRFCAQNSLILTQIFKDEKRPGSTVVGRQQFHEMIRHFREGAKEQGVILWKFSRFARDQDDAQFYKADLRRRGYIVHALMDKIPSGPEGRFFEAALDWMNQKFLEDLSSDVKRGLRHLVEHYRCVPGVPPRGIRRVPVVIGQHRDGRDHIAHRWEPDPEWVGRVRLAFELKAQGVALDSIRAETGLYQNRNSYITFFTNKIWLGILEYGEDILIENYCEPVISRELWDQVQKQIELYAQRQHMHSDRLHPRRKHSRFLLSGLVFCPRCGSAMSGFASKNGYGKQYDRYGCGRAKRRGDCKMQTLPRYGLEKAVIEQLTEHCLQPAILTRLLDELNQEASENQAALTTQLAEVRLRLKGVSRALENVAQAIEESGHSPTLLARLKALENDRAQLEHQMDALQIQQQPPGPLQGVWGWESDLLETAAGLRQALRHGDDQTRREILLGLVQKVVVERYGRQMVGNVRFYLPTKNAGSLASGQATTEKLDIQDGGPDGGRIIDTSNKHVFKLSFVAPIRNAPATQKKQLAVLEQ